MAISNKMKAQIDALDKAQSNAADAKNTIEIADGALNEVSSILQRIRELSVQGRQWYKMQIVTNRRHGMK